MNLFCRLFILVFVIFIEGIGLLYAQSPIVYLEWTEDPLRSIVVNWVNNPGGTSELEYRSDGSSNWISRSGAVYTIPGPENKRRYSIHIDALTPGTSYEFRVDGDPEIYRFRTPPSTLDNPIQFIIAGDMYGHPNERTTEEMEQIRQTFREMSEQAASRDPWFAVWGGDLAHSNADPDYDFLWMEMMSAWYEHMRTPEGYMVPIVAGIGNNDTPTGYGHTPDEAIFYHSFFSFPQDQWSQRRSYGVLDFGDYLSLIMLDTDHTTPIAGSQSNWLDSRLHERREQRHVFPVYHVAGWPTFRAFRGTQEDAIRNHWHPIFEKHETRLVFEHHCHIYKRTVPIGTCDYSVDHINRCSETTGGIVYAGGGSWASLSRDLNAGYAPDGAWYHETWKSENNFVLVEVGNSYRQTTAYTKDGTELDSYREVVWLPAPQILSASEITDSSFRANWEAVEDATSYRLDVATDSDFDSFLPGYQDRNVGNKTSRVIDGLDSDLTYHYRVRARRDSIRSGRSQPMTVHLKVDPPLLSEAVHIGGVGFTHHWEEVERADEYLVDVSLDSTFSSFVDQYENFSVGEQTTIDIQGLLPGTGYYVRVRAKSETVISESSNVVFTRTLPINVEDSIVDLSQARILANGIQEASISIMVVDDDQLPLGQVPISLMPIGNQNSPFSEMQGQTDENGEIEFVLKSETDGEVTYRVLAGGLELNPIVNIEFLSIDEQPRLGDNFPNPFFDQTYIPFTLPIQASVRVEIFSITGMRVHRVLDETLPAGHYEIPFQRNDLASGSYIYRIIVNDWQDSKGMTKLN